MLFNSFIFLFFLGMVLPFYYVLQSKQSRNSLLLLASYLFYGYWDWRFCGLLCLSTVIDFFIGKKIAQTKQSQHKWYLLLVSLCSNLGILAFFKYFNFFTDSFEQLLGGFGFQADFLHLHILLPIGISFYTFQTLSYTIDIYRGRLKPTANFIDFALFVAFFPQLVAGPIERARKMIPQVSRKNSASRQQWQDGICLIIYGLFKKVLIGDAAGRYVDHIFGQMEYYAAWEIVFALFLFSIQIYADFSAYSSIARGTAKLFGFELMRNFKQPYLSTNITEFWRRWHISLSSWLKDYLYIPLGGNRKGYFRTYINLFITMLLGGLWHGASWTFVIWGALHGAYLAIHKWILQRRTTATANPSSFLATVCSIIGTYILVLIAWLVFRIENMEQLALFFNKMTNWTWGNYPLRFLTILLGFSGLTLIFDWAEQHYNSPAFLNKMNYPSLRFAFLVAMFFTVIVFMINSKPLPFVYFQF